MGGAGFSLFNPEAAILVLCGTIIATALASGWANLQGALLAASCLVRQPLDEAANRAVLARLVYAISRQGRFGVDKPLPPDPALAELVAAYLRLGDIAAHRKAWRAQRAAGAAQQCAAIRTWRRAGELAPVAGLAGTLYAIAGLGPPDDGALAATTATAVATAVLSTLYGLLLAHLVCLPLAGAIMRRAQAEHAVRASLVRWFESQLPSVRPQGPCKPSARLAQAA